MNNVLNEKWTEVGYTSPIFTRTQVAKLLNCTPLTIANREKKEIYPEPKRSKTSLHRVYSLQDAFLLQYITNSQINLSSITSLLWDMGYTNSKDLLKCLELEISLFKSNPLVTNVKDTNVVQNG